MPKYTFICQKCGKSIQKYAAASQRFNQCECGQQVERQMPNLAGTKTTETVDKLLNRKHTVDQENSMKERKLTYYWEVEVPNMVNSGVYSIETMLEQGWIYYNEKGELTTRTKPVQKS
jgi:intracellular sulfur oxidation DsrE/DsrF family protein